MLYTRFIAVTLALVLCLSGAASAQDHYTERYSLDIRAAAFMDRLYEVLTREQWLGSIPEVRGMAELAREMGLFNFTSLSARCVVEHGRAEAFYSERYENLAPDSYLGRMLSLPNKPLISSTYLAADDYVLYMGATNVPQHAFLTIEEIGRLADSDGLGGLLGSEAADVAQGLAMLRAFDVESQVADVLTGEVALALFDLPGVEKLKGDLQPEDLSMAAFIGLRDATRLRELAAAFGSQAGLTPMEGQLGEWTGYRLPGLHYGGMMFNHEMLIVSPNIYAIFERLDFARGGRATAPVQCLTELNLTRLHDGFVGPLAHKLAGKSGVNLQSTSDAAAYLFALPPSSQLGTLTASAGYDSGYYVNLSMNTALANYLAYYLGVGISGAAQADMLH